MTTSLPRVSTSVVTTVMALSTMFIGLIIGFIDIHNAQAVLGEIEFYVLVCAVLSWTRPKLLWLWPMLFAFTLYTVHIWAIRHGYRQPYVEKDEDHALVCLFSFFPAFVGSLLGSGLRALCNGWRALKELEQRG